MINVGGGRGGWRVHFGTPPVFRAPREGDGRSAPVHGRVTLHTSSRTQKKLHGKGTNTQTHRQTDIATSRKNWPKGDSLKNLSSVSGSLKIFRRHSFSIIYLEDHQSLNMWVDYNAVCSTAPAIDMENVQMFTAALRWGWGPNNWLLLQSTIQENMACKSLILVIFIQKTG